MSVATLVLEYIKVLAWPAVIIGLALRFRVEFRAVLGRVRRIAAAGAEVELFDRKTDEVTEQLDSIQRDTEHEVAEITGGRSLEFAQIESWAREAVSMAGVEELGVRGPEFDKLVSKLRHPSRALALETTAKRLELSPQIETSVLTETFHAGSPATRIRATWLALQHMVSDIAYALAAEGPTPVERFRNAGVIAPFRSWTRLADSLANLEYLAQIAEAENPSTDQVSEYISLAKSGAATILSLFRAVEIVVQAEWTYRVQESPSADPQA